MLNKNYNAILFGLGSIGAGSGIYNKKWNNHLDSLKRASWIENIYIFDPFVDVKGFINKNIFDFLNLNIPNDKPVLFIDAGPASGRVHRVSRIYDLCNPDLCLIEKPTNSAELHNKNELFGKNIRINYFRRALETTNWLKSILKEEKIENIDVKISNGFFNAGTHLFDLLDFLGFEITDSDISVSNNKNFIRVNYLENAKKDVFEVIFKSKKTKIKYLNFGSLIKINNEVFENNDIHHRLQNIYQSQENFNKLTNIETDIKTHTLCAHLKELWEKK